MTCPTPRQPVAPYAAEELRFYTQQGRRYQSQPVVEWLFSEMSRQGLHGATISAGTMGEGRDGETHVITMFDDAEQPMQVTAVATSELCDRFLACLEGRGLNVFYTRKTLVAGVV